MNDYLNVAIDGPSGAGKSSISKAAADRLGFIYIDTGALYRVVGLSYLKLGKLDLSRISLSLEFVDKKQHVFDNGADITEEIRRHEVSKAASDCSALPEVRAFLLDTQRNLAAGRNVIMDGRDIGTVVLPDAGLKIFLTASAEIRAKRRHLELIERGEEIPYEQILRDIIARDKNDTERKEAPLKRARDAVLLDTTNKTFEQSVAAVEELIVEKSNVL